MSRPCTTPRCYNLQPCALHARKPFANRSVPYAGGRPWQRIRARILARDGGQCCLRLPGCTFTATVVDHVLNRARGGSDDDGNLQAACRACNETKRRGEARAGLRRACERDP